MRRYLLDTNAVGAFMARKPVFAGRLKQARGRGDQIGTIEAVVGELFYGIELSISREENIARLERALAHIRTWPFDRTAAKEYGRIAAELRRRGRRIQVVDMMIAAVARSLGNCTVVTTDSDLSEVPGLGVINWEANVITGES